MSTRRSPLPARRSPLRFAGLATQWAVLLGLAVWGGLKLDQWLKVPAAAVVVLPLAALGYALWSLIKELSKKDS